MADDPAPEPAESAAAPALDPAQLEYLRRQMASEENLVLGVVAGAGASVLGAGLWAAITIATGYQVGFMAIGVGLLVGLSVRALGRGVSSVFGIVGGGLSLVGCALGNLLAVTAIIASQQGMAFSAALAELDLEAAVRLMIAFFSPMDLLFYGIAIYEGYRLSFRRLTPQEMEQMLSGSAGPAL